MNPEMQTTLLNAYSPKLIARREEIDWVHSEGVYEIVPMQECRDAGIKPLDLIWVDTDKSVDPTRKKIRSRLCAREYTTKKQGKIQRALPASQLFSAMAPFEAVKVLVSIVMSVSLSNNGTIEIKTLRHQQSILSRNNGETHLQQTFCRGSSEAWRRQSWQIFQEHVRTSRCFPHLAT